METDILKSFGSLQNELEEAKKSLKSVDDSIKKVIGRHPSDLPPKVNKKRAPPVDEKGRAGLKFINRIRNNTYEIEAPLSKRRNNDSVFKRLSTTVQEDVHQDLQKQIISKVIVTSKEVPSREEALEAQKKDEKFRARNRRMFGALLGTLQKFQQEETKLKPREEKRAQLEKKIEEHEIKEKEEIKKERHELFLSRKKKQIEIKIIELKMAKMKEYTLWMEYQKPRENFILTKAEPHINYLPRRLNAKTKELLSSSKQDVQTAIEKRSVQLSEELKYIEDKMKRNFNNKYGLKDAKENEEISCENLDHEASSELTADENNVSKDEVNDVAENPLEDESSNQDKENEIVVDDQEPTEVVPESNVHSSSPDISNSEVV